MQVRSHLAATLVTRYNHGDLSRGNSVQTDQPLDCRREHDADQVIVREKQRRLKCARRHHNPLSAQMNQPFRPLGIRARLEDAQQVAFVKAKTVAPFQHMDVGKRSNPRDELRGGITGVPRIAQMATQRRLIVYQGNLLSLRRMLQRSSETRRTASNNGHFRVPIAVLVQRIVTSLGKAVRPSPRSYG